MGGIAPVRQSDRLVGFTAEARARRYLAPRPARNAVTPLPHIPWRSHLYVAFLVCRIERENFRCFCPCHNVASGASEIGTFETCRRTFEKCLFVGVDRKPSAVEQNGAFDPEPTSSTGRSGLARTLGIVTRPPIQAASVLQKSIGYCGTPSTT